MKNVWWSDVPKRSGVFGGHLDFGHRDRYWDFRSLGRGRIEFEEVVRALNRINYQGPLSIEWEDIGMDREHGAKEACSYLRSIDFPPSSVAFDAASPASGLRPRRLLPFRHRASGALTPARRASIFTLAGEGRGLSVMA